MPHLNRPHGHASKYLTPKKKMLGSLPNFSSYGGDVGDYKLGTHANKLGDGTPYRGANLGNVVRGTPTYPHSRETVVREKLRRRKGITHGYRRGSDVKNTSAGKSFHPSVAAADATEHMKITSMKTRHTTYKGHGWSNYKGKKHGDRANKFTPWSRT